MGGDVSHLKQISFEPQASQRCWEMFVLPASGTVKERVWDARFYFYFSTRGWNEETLKEIEFQTAFWRQLFHGRKKKSSWRHLLACTSPITSVTHFPAYVVKCSWLDKRSNHILFGFIAWNLEIPREESRRVKLQRNLSVMVPMILANYGIFLTTKSFAKVCHFPWTTFRNTLTCFDLVAWDISLGFH